MQSKSGCLTWAIRVPALISSFSRSGIAGPFIDRQASIQKLYSYSGSAT